MPGPPQAVKVSHNSNVNA